MTFDNTDDDHLKEAAKSHNFKNKEEEDAWTNVIKKFDEWGKAYEIRIGEEEPNDYIDDLIDEYHFKTLWDTGEIWYYKKDRGIYVPHAEYIIKERIEYDHKGNAGVNNKSINEYIGQIQRRTYTNRSAFNPSIE